MPSPIINLSALEPLYLPHEMLSHHRIRAEREGDPAKKVKGRRTSDIIIAQNLRRYVTEWRETDYPGASDTTRELLHHWFGRDHAIKNNEGEVIPFKYYFCQREAIETFIYLRELRGLDTLSAIVSEFGGECSAGNRSSGRSMVKVCFQSSNRRRENKDHEPCRCVELFPLIEGIVFSNDKAFCRNSA